MKLTCYLAAFAAFATLATPGVAAGPALDKAVALSAPSSNASLSAICKSVYDAVKEDPEEADKVFSEVLAQRTTWKSSEVYAIFRAIVLARPELGWYLAAYADYKSGEGSSDQSSSSGSGDASGEGGAGSSGGAGSTGGVDPAIMNLMFYRLMNVLYEASLEDGVAKEAIDMLAATTAGAYEGAYTPTTRNPNTNTNRLPDDGIGIIPSPGDMSRAN